MIDKMKVACFSGHRKLPQDCTELQANLEKAIITLIERGVVFFGAGLHSASISLRRQRFCG